jgi:hypothetical protein
MIPLVQFLHAVVWWAQDFIPPAEFFVYPYLTARGLLPYTQIIDHHFPGLFFFPVNFFSLGFTDPLSFKTLALLVVLLTSVLLSRLAKHHRISPGQVVTVIALYSVWQIFFSGSTLWIDLFLPVFLLPGWELFRRRRFFLSGVMFALALVFKQTVILPLIFTCLFLFRSPKALVTFLFPPAVAVLLTWGYFFFRGSGSDFWYWNFVFNFQTYAREAGRLPGIGDLLKLSLPLTLYFLAVINGFRHHDKPLLQLAGLVGLLALPGFSRFGLEHFQPAVPFFALLLVIGFSELPSFRWLLLPVSCLFVLVFQFRHPPAGQIVNFSPADYRVYDRAAALAVSGRTLAVLGASPLIYSQAKTLPVGNLFFFPLPWLFSPLQPRQLDIWADSPPDVIIFDPHSRVDGRSIFTSADRLIEYMQRNYRQTEEISGQLIYTRL